MRVQILTLLVLASLNVCSFADQFRVGARMHVKEMSMWFQTETDLTVWQRFQKVATPTVLEPIEMSFSAAGKPGSLVTCNRSNPQLRARGKSGKSRNAGPWKSPAGWQHMVVGCRRFSRVAQEY
jgi:hypothetical protein